MKYLLLILSFLLLGSTYAQKVDSIHKADFAVLSKQQLFNALDSAENGQSIYVADWLNLDLSDTLDLIVPSGVKLLSQGATITYTRTFDDGTYHGLFVMQDSSYIGCDQQCQEGFTLKGYNCEREPIEIDGIRQSSNAIRVTGKHATIRGNVIECFGKWAIDLEHNEDSHIVQNAIFRTQEEGYGYGVWLRGADSELDSTQVTVIEGNLFYKTRNAVDRGSQAYNSAIIQYNASYGAYQSHFDTHSSGGHDTWVTNNLCLTKGPCARLTGHPEGDYWFTGNVSNQWSQNSIIWFSGDANKDSSNVHVFGNTVAMGRGY